MRTSNPKPSAPQWLLLDADGQMLGKVAALAAKLLRGKHKAIFSPNALHGDHVVIVNAGKISISPKKARTKLYHHHTSYLGHLKTKSLETTMKEKPTAPLERAIYGMLPRNRLRREMLKRLHLFAEEKHTYDAQQPKTVSLNS